MWILVASCFDLESTASILPASFPVLLRRIAFDASSFFLSIPISAGGVFTSCLRPDDHTLRTATLWIDVSRNIVLAGLRPALNYIP